MMRNYDVMLSYNRTHIEVCNVAAESKEGAAERAEDIVREELEILEVVEVGEDW